MKVVNIHQKVKEKQELKMAMELLKDLKEYKSFIDYEKDKLSNETIASIVRVNLEWFTA